MMVCNSIAVVVLVVVEGSTQSFPIAKAGCEERCGDVGIPYPFGTEEECYQNYSFKVRCNETFDPPKAFLEGSDIEITEISVSGQLRIRHLIARECYAADGTLISKEASQLTLATYLTVNSTANKFTIVGCDADAFISGRRLDRSYKTGCTAMCDSPEDLTEGYCTGAGCCQTSIPDGVWDVRVDLSSYSNYTYVWDFDNCGYAFLVEESAFTFSSENLTNLGFVERVPLVLDWAIGNGTCQEARSNPTSYACVSANSRCYEPATNGYGYRCACEDGYQGTAYLLQGCRDIDECGNSSLHDCMEKARCTNTIGSYTCSCPMGYSGNGRGPNGCIDINECADIKSNNCTKQEYCTNTDGSFTCFCPKGYSGDGRGRHGCARKDTKTAYILIGIAFGITIVLIAAIFCYMELKRRSSNAKKQKFFRNNGGFLLQKKLSTSNTQRSPDAVKIFTSSELHNATKGFHASMIVGQGGFGTVYRGILCDKTTVAIKRSKKVEPTQIEQFINEVLVLSQINHRNVVRLLGCCLDTESPLLVYEFVPNGTLASHVHRRRRRENAPPLPWRTRVRIAAETAGVLAYLHSAASTPIIHRDVKSENILLDEKFTAKVSDFGASKLVPLDLTQLSTMVQGTFGYLDPEYMQTSQLTEKSDVYSFGVVLLELLTGRNAVSFEGLEHERNLANYFLYMSKQNRLREILDDSVVGDGNTYMMEEIARVGRLAKECLSVKGENRPSMKEVAMELERMIMVMKGNHLWSRDDEEKEALMFDEEGFKVFEDNGDANGKTSSQFFSIWARFVSRFNGGR